MTPTNRPSLPGVVPAASAPTRGAAGRLALTRLTLVLVACLLAVAPRAAFGQAAIAGAAGSTNGPNGDEGNPWRGSSIWYTHQGSLWSLTGNDLYANPYYGHQVMLRPTYHFNNAFWMSGQFTLANEFTTPDDGIRFAPSDVLLEGFWAGVSEPTSKIRFAGSLRAVVPTSPNSYLVNSVITGIAPTVRASRSFEVLGGLSVVYFARFTKWFNRYESQGNAGSGMSYIDCSYELPTCIRLAQTGPFNTNWSVMQGPIVTLSLTDALSFTLMSGLVMAQPYGGTDVDVPVQGGVAHVPAANSGFLRYSTLVSLSGYYQLNEIFGVNFGAYTFANQLQGNGTLQNPIWNRSINASLDLAIDIERLVTHTVLASTAK